MICIVVAQNVMCLYVQMCMSILRVFIIFSVVMVGLLSVCLLLVCWVVFQFTSQDMLFTALFLAWYWLPAEDFKHENTHFWNCCFTNVEWHANPLQGWTICTHEIYISGLFSHRETNIKRPSPASAEEYGWTLNRVICLSTSGVASCELPSIDQRETKHTAFLFRRLQSTLNRTFLSYDL